MMSTPLRSSLLIAAYYLIVGTFADRAAGRYPFTEGAIVRATLVVFIVASIAWLAAVSCSPSPRFFDDAGAPDAGANSMPGWRLSWAVRAGGGENDWEPGTMDVREAGLSVVALEDGCSYLGGQAAEAAVFGEGEPNETHFLDEYVEWSDGFVARYYQDGSLEWVRRIGGDGEDHAKGVAAADNGSAVVAGWFRSTEIVLGEGEPNETVLASPLEASTGYLAKYRSDGELGWAVQIPQTDETNLYAHTVHVLSDGRILVSGTLRGTAWPGEPFEVVSETSDSPSEWDSYLAWFDTQGEAVSAIRIGGDVQTTHHHAVVALEDGSAVAAMAYGYDEVFGKGEPNETTLSCALQEDDCDCASLARYSAEGSLEWVRDLGVMKAREWTVELSEPASVIVTGCFHLAPSNPELNPSEFALGEDEVGSLVAQFDVDDGDLQWSRFARSDSCFDEMYTITPIPGGGGVSGMPFFQSLEFEGLDAGQRVLASDGKYDIALVRFSATGEILWMYGMGNGGNEGAGSSAQLDGSSIWLTGYYSSNPFVAGSGHDDDVVLPLDGYTDIFLMRFDATSSPSE